MRGARIWLGELPDWGYEPAEMVERRHQAPAISGSEVRQAAIEFLVPAGGRFHYGGVEAIFTPAETGQLVLQVPASTNDSRLIGESVAGKLDTVYVGLPRAYAAGVLEGMTEAIGSRPLGAGTARIVGAIYGAVGSSAWFFGVLGSCVVRLLSLAHQEQVSQEELLDAVQTALRSAKRKVRGTEDVEDL